MLNLENTVKLTCKRKENPSDKINYLRKPVSNLMELVVTLLRLKVIYE